MSQPPAPYDRSYSFTDFSESNPTTPHQGQKIDQELNNARTAINSTIARLGEVQADDGKIRTTALNLTVIAEEVEPLLTDAPIQAVEAAGAQQIGLVNDAGDAKVAELEAVLSSQNALDAISARDEAVAAADSADAFAVSAENSATASNSYANTALQAKNSAQTYAQVAQDAAGSVNMGGYALLSGASFSGNVTVSGRMAIGGILANSSSNKLAIHNGNIVFTAGYGIAFGDGTTQTTAATTPDLTGYATQSWVASQGYLTSVPSGYATESWVSGQGYLTSVPSGYATESFVTSQGYLTSVPSGYATESFVTSQGYLTSVPYGYATESFVTSQGYISADSSWQIASINASYYGNVGAPSTSGPYSFTYYDSWAGTDVTTQLEIQSPVDGVNYDGYSVGFDSTQPYGYYQVGGNSVTIGINGYSSLQDALNSLASGVGGWKLFGSGSPYVSADVLTGAGHTVYRPTSSAEGNSFVIREGLYSTLNDMFKSLGMTDKIIGTDANGSVNGYAKSSFATSTDLAYKANLSGATFTGKVNTVAPTANNAGINIGTINSTGNLTNSIAGDVWIGTWQMAYKTANGTLVYGAATNASNVFGSPQIIDTTAATPALRVTQKGTGNSLIVEDSLNPDSTALVVDASGNVGIGVATGFVATSKLDVVGNSKATTFSNGSGPAFSVNSTTSHSGGSDTMDLLVTIGGVNYRIGLRPA